MKKKLFFSIAAVAGMMAVCAAANTAVGAKADACADGWDNSVAGRVVSEADGKVTFGTDVYGVMHQTADKVYLDGMSFTFGYGTMGSAKMGGFWFGKAKSTSFSFEKPVISMLYDVYGGQTRIYCTNSHDYNDSASYWYPSIDAAAPGVGGQVSPQIVGNATADALNFAFEHVTKSWWKMTITEVTGSTIWGDTANYSKPQGASVATVTTYLKDSDLNIDADGGCYLKVYGTGGSVYLDDIVWGKSKTIAEDPATAQQIADYKTAINALPAEYPEAFQTKATELKDAALALIDEKTYPSEMAKVVEDLKADMKTAYLAMLGYAEVNVIDPTANFYSPWGQPVFAKRLNNRGGILMGLTNAWGVRGELIKQYDPRNYEMELNLAAVKKGTIIAINLSNAYGGYIDGDNLGTRFYSFDIYINEEGSAHVVLSNTANHNVSVEGWGTENVNTFIGKSFNIGKAGNLSIKVSTNGNVSTVNINGFTAEITGLLRNIEGDKAFVQFGAMSGSGVDYVQLVKMEDADAKAYADGLEERVTNAQSLLVAAANRVVSEYNPYGSDLDAEYAEYLAAYNANLSIFQSKFGLTQYDYNYFMGGLLDQVAAYVNKPNQSYGAVLGQYITAANSIVASYVAEDYREAEQEVLANAKAAYAEAIEECDSIADVKALVAQTVTALDAIKTNEQLAAEEALAAAKTAAKAVVDAMLDLANDDNVTDVAAAIGTAKAAIMAAESLAEVELAKVAGVEAVNAVLHAKDVVSIAVEGAPVKFNVGKEFAAPDMVVKATLKDGTVVDVTADAEVNVEAVDMNKAGAYTVKVSYSGAEASFIIIVTPEVVAQEGCAGSVVAAAGLISLLATAGAVLVTTKRRK